MDEDLNFEIDFIQGKKCRNRTENKRKKYSKHITKINLKPSKCHLGSVDDRTDEKRKVGRLGSKK